MSFGGLPNLAIINNCICKKRKYCTGKYFFILVISGHDVHEIFTFLGYYAALNDSYVLTFRDYLSVPLRRLRCERVYKGVNNSHYKGRPPYTGMDRPLGLQTVEAPRISRQSAHQGGSRKHRPPLLPRKYSWYSFLLEAKSTRGPYCDRKNYVNKRTQ
jgi:hypothetical protein